MHVYVNVTENLTLTNRGKHPISIGAVKVSGAGFSLGPLHCADPLAPGEACGLYVNFVPTTDRHYSGSLKIKGNRVSLKGLGVGSATARPVAGDVILVGNLGFGGASGAAIELYQAATNDFAPAGATPNMNTSRSAPTATLLDNGKILIAGGVDQNGAPLASTELYDPTTNSFAAPSHTATMNTARVGAAAILLASGNVLIAGGGGEGVLLASTELYDPTTNSFAPPNATATMNTARATATLLSTGKVLIAGGASDASTELYDPATNSFAPPGATASMNVVRDGASAVELANGNVLIACGVSPYAPPPPPFDLYDEATNTFVPASAIPANAAVDGDCTAVLLTTGPYAGQVMILGAYGHFGFGTSAIQLYDPATNSFAPPGTIPSGCIECNSPIATMLDNGKVLILSDAFAGSAIAQLYDPTTNAFVAGPGQPPFGTHGGETAILLK